MPLILEVALKLCCRLEQRFCIPHQLDGSPTLFSNSLPASGYNLLRDFLTSYCTCRGMIDCCASTEPAIVRCSYLLIWGVALKLTVGMQRPNPCGWIEAQRGLSMLNLPLAPQLLFVPVAVIYFHSCCSFVLRLAAWSPGALDQPDKLRSKLCRGHMSIDNDCGPCMPELTDSWLPSIVIYRGEYCSLETM